MIQTSLQSSERLFSLSVDVKLNSTKTISSSGRINRGYLGFGLESGLLESNFEPKEGYCYGHKLLREPSNIMEAHNIWSDEFSNADIENLETLYERKVDFAEVLFSKLQTQLNLNTGSNFQSSDYSGGREISLLRLFHYFPGDFVDHQSSSNNSECIGSSPHTDWGLLTLISQQDSVGGLQFFYDGQWRDVPVLPGSIVVNSGDYLKLISRGRFHSPVHRVLCPPVGKERTSFVLFYYPGYHAPMYIPPLPLPTLPTQPETHSQQTHNRKEPPPSGNDNLSPSSQTCDDPDLTRHEQEVGEREREGEVKDFGGVRVDPLGGGQHRTRTRIPTEQFNTLLESTTSTSSSSPSFLSPSSSENPVHSIELDEKKKQETMRTMKFGEYILEKWKNVMREY